MQHSNSSVVTSATNNSLRGKKLRKIFHTLMKILSPFYSEAKVQSLLRTVYAMLGYVFVNMHVFLIENQMHIISIFNSIVNR